MKKGFALIAVFLMVTLSLSAFASEGQMVLAGLDVQDTGHDWKNNLFFDRMAEVTGVSFELNQFTDNETWKKEKQGYQVGGSLPDVLFKAQLSPQETLELYEKGVLINLRPYLAEHAPNLWALLESHPDWLRAISLPGGAIAALPQIDSLMSNNAMWINAKWLRALGLAMPTTAEELVNVLRAFKSQDPNMNGRSDEVPLTFTGLWDLRFLQHAFGWMANDYGVAVDGQGRVREYLTADENRAFLEWLHTLWEEKLIDKDGFSTPSSTRAITDSKATPTYGIVFGPTPMAMLPTEMTTDYELLVPLQAEGKQVYRSLLGELRRGTFAVTSACRDIPAALRWVDYLYTEEGCYLARSGLQGKEYERLSDGTWYWLDSEDIVANTVLRDITISEGTTIPGYTPESFSLHYDNETAAPVVAAISRLAAIASEPYPQVYLTREQQEKVDTLWPALTTYAENTMACFVTGDIPLTDASWTDFTGKVKAMGMDELLQIWQAAYDAQYGS